MKWLSTWIMDRIAEDGSSEWAFAMRREFDELERGHLGWAAGSLLALSKGYAKRKARFVSALVLVPLISLVFGTAVTLACYSLFFEGSNAPRVVMSLPAIVLQLPFAFFLGTVRPLRAPFLVGAMGFVSHQFFPAFLFWMLFAAPFHFWWGPNVTIYNMTPAMGYACSLAMWLVGAALGAKFARTRLDQ